MGRHPWPKLAASLAALAAGAACGGAGVPAPRVQRLASQLGDVRLVEARPDARLAPGDRRRMQVDARLAARLAPGDRRRMQVDTRAGGRLSFALAVGGGAPGGALRLTLRAGGELAWERLIPPRPWPRWRSQVVDLPSREGLALEWECSLVSRSGGPLQGQPGEAWVEVAGLALGPARPAPPGRALVWISLDTVRADRLSLYGAPRPTTPNLERRARQWVVFDDASAPASWTLPSMTSQFTSQLPARHGATDARRARQRRQPTVFEALWKEGFTVLGVSANRFVSPAFGLASGFDRMYVEETDASAVTQQALASLGSWPGGDLALFAHYMDPHLSYSPPTPFDRMFDPDYAGATRGHRPGSPLPARDAEHLRALYDGELAYTDAQVELLLRALEERGLLQRAVIVVSSDHGEELGERGTWGHSHSVQRELLHVPLTLAAPGLKPARVSRAVSLVDLAPTLLEALSVAVPGGFEGVSLLPLARGQRPATSPVLAETRRNPDGRLRLALHEGSRTLLATLDSPRPGSEPRLEEVRLFDLARDPAEQRPGPPDASAATALAQLTAYARLAQETQAGSDVALEGELLERLRALGYVQ